MQGDDVALHARLVLLLRLQLVDEGVGRAGEAVELAWLGSGLGLGSRVRVRVRVRVSPSCSLLTADYSLLTTYRRR